MDRVIKQACSAFSIIRRALSANFSSLIISSGFSLIFVTSNLPSTFPSSAVAFTCKSSNESLEYSAIATKVVIKQLLTDDKNRCSGDQIPSTPPSKSGGVATSISSLSSGERNVPNRPSFQDKFTLYLCSSLMRSPVFG